MAKYKKTAYWLLLLTFLCNANMMLLVQPSQAHYVNTCVWNTVVQTEEETVSSDCLVDISGAPLTVLLGEMPLEETTYTFGLRSSGVISGKLSWQMENAPLEIRMMVGQLPLTPESEITLLPEQTTQVKIILTPTESAFDLEREAQEINIVVTWNDMMKGTFRVTLPVYVEETEQETEETTEPETEETTEPETEETTEPETEEATEPETKETTEPETGETTEPETMEPEITAPTQPTQTTAPETTAPTQPTQTTALETTTAAQPTQVAVPESTTATQPTRAAIPETTAPIQPTQVAVPESTTATQPTQAAIPETTTPQVAERSLDFETMLAEDTESTTNTETAETAEIIQEEEPIDLTMEMLPIFDRNGWLPVKFTMSDSVSRIQLGSGEIEESAFDQYSLWGKTRYSLDRGESWYMLYQDDLLTIVPKNEWDGSLLLDFSWVETLEGAMQIPLVAEASTPAGQMILRKAVSNIDTVADTNEETVAGLNGTVMTRNSPLTIPLPEVWRNSPPEYTISRLAVNDQGEVEYQDVDLTAGLLLAGFTPETEPHALVLETAELLAPAGTYRANFEWKFKDICFAKKQVTFFINYSAYSGTGNREVQDNE